MHRKLNINEGLRHEHRSPPKSIEYDFVELDGEDLERGDADYNWDDEHAEE